MPEKRQSRKQIIDQQRRENFVGRGDQLRAFLDNLCRDEPPILLFSVVGEGGVGKSTLLKQFETAAKHENIDAIFVTCNDEYLSPAAAMGHIAAELAKHDIKHKDFDERFKTWRTKKEEIEADPKAPRGALNLVVRGMTDLAIKSARHAPGVGVFADYVDEKAAGEAAAEGVDYLISKWGNKDEVQLLREPERILTPLLIELLNKACEKQRVVLMFDVFERTQEALNPWLLKFLNFEYGDFNPWLLFVIGGRDPLEQRWTEMAVAISHFDLEPFTLDETRDYLSNRGITDEQLSSQIYADTGGLPVLVELLAGTNPQPGLPLPDISKDAVKRFLQWIPEPERRQVALLAAAPRQFNRDILSAALGKDAAQDFDWLSSQSYIRTNTTRGWFYHEKVRELMLRYLRNTQPGDLTASHLRLAQSFEAHQTDTGLTEKAAYDSQEWRKCETERVYHLLCAKPERNASQAINAFLIAFRWRWGFAQEITQTCQQASHETVQPELEHQARILEEFYSGYDKNEYERLIEHANQLSQRTDLTFVAQSQLLSKRGWAYLQMSKYDEALADFNRAIELDDKLDWAIANRGLTYRLMDKYDEALVDFNRALELDDKYAWAIANRGLTYRLMSRYAEALADFTRALELDDKYAWAIASRGETYRLLGKYDEALADFTRALELDDKYAWAIASRGLTYRLLGKYDEALIDFNRALELDDKYAWAIANRGVTYQLLGKYDEALIDFNRALELDDKLDWAIANRGLTYRLMGKYDEALADFTRALELDDKYAWAIASRGETYRLLGKYDEALADFTRALELDDKYAWAIASRGLTYRLLGKYDEALIDFNRALELDDKYAWAIANRGVTYQLLGKYDEALIDFNRALELDDKLDWAIANRGLTYRLLGKYDEALADFTRALELDDKYAWAIANRGETYRLMSRYDEALADFTRALELDDKYAWAIANRGVTYQLLGKYDEALADFTRALELDDKDAWAIAHRGETYWVLSKYEEALADFTRALELDDKDAWAIASRGETYRLMSRYDEALADFTRALELDDKDAWGYQERGETYRRLGQYEPALHDFSRAIALDPKDDRFPRTRRAAVYRAMGDSSNAEKDIAHVLELPLNDADAFYNQCVAFVLQGNFGPALAALREAIQRDSSNRFYAQQDDLLDPIRQLPEFQALMSEA